MTSTPPHELTLDDRREISELVAAYARFIDRREYDSLPSLFAADGRLGVVPTGSGDAPSWVDGDGFAAMVRQGHAQYRITTHFIGQHTVRTDGAEVRGETYCLAHHLFDEDGRWFNRVASIRYHDRFAGWHGDWRFGERRVLIDWIELRPMSTEPTDDGWAPASPA